MKRWRGVLLPAVAAVVLLGWFGPLKPSVATAASPASASAVCVSQSHPALAAAVARDITAARSGRLSTVAVWVDAPLAGLSCSLNGSAQFDSASAVKATILGALLRKALDQHRFLTRTEAAEARGMITMSDNDDASALWAELGHPYLQHFLNLTGMRQTILGPDGFWGLTQITAHDEMLLLRVLATVNAVLDSPSRAYELDLMAQVIPAQRWGVPAGAPTRVTVHVKNGWLPRATHGWRIHSIGVFSWPKHWYSIVVLTQDNPTMAYGIATIEAIARAVHHDLNPTVTSVIPGSRVSPSWGTPDERLPALPAIP
jgi:beta-lactamase class A